MTNSPTTEPPEPTESDSEVGHHQFTIMSLMILTAAVAVFFAIATQVGLIYAAGYLHLVLVILTLKYRRGWKGITAINFLLFIVMATQIPFIIVVGYFHIVLLIIALSHPTQAIGIMGINYSIFNIYFLPVILMQSAGGFGALILVPMSILASFLYSFFLILSSSDFNRLYGYIIVVINVLLIGWYVILLN